MPFDGEYHASPVLIARNDYHPGAPATGECLSRTLTTAYSYARTHGRWVGSQTYFTMYDQARRLDPLGALFFREVDWVDIAQFRLPNLPAHRTHMWAEAHYLLAGEACIAHLRIQIADSSGETTENGNDFTREHEPFQPQHPPGWTAGGVTASVSFNAEVLTRGMNRCHIDCQSFQDAGDITIRVQAYADSLDGTRSVAYHPEQIVCWMDSVD